MSLYEYFVIDTFASGPFTGNPAGVVVDATRLSDQQMQAIAREFNLTETAFVLPATQPNAAVRFRTFTPTEERCLSGHSILAGVATLLRLGRFTALFEQPGTLLPIETSWGTVDARVERLQSEGDEFLVWLRLRRPLLKRFRHDPAKTAGMLGIAADKIDQGMPAMQTQDDDVILFVDGLMELMQARPDFAALGEYSRRREIRTWCIASLETLTDSINAHVRCFSPGAGVDEDAVTASAHGPLATYLVIAGEIGVVGDRAAVALTQSDSTGRAGLVRTLVAKAKPSGYEAWISGQCFVAMTGQIHVPS
ncbi:MAG: PhzF family phenazine biosynthesis protein [Phycisphaerae bacterium]|nr:PhzF family phenazine biosynthesis protein [Phycisphaerae bacterium]